MKVNELEKQVEKETKAKFEVTNKDLMTLYWRQWNLMNTNNVERWESLGYTWSFVPLFEKIYGKGTPEMKEALVANMAYFNTTPQMAPIIMGLHAAMLQEGASHEEINNMKTALMGPFAGIGDPLWYAMIRTVFETIAIGFASMGSLLCIPMLLVPFVAIMMAFMWYSLKWSYHGGRDFLKSISGETFHKYMDYAGMLAVGTIGGLTALWVGGIIPLTLNLEGVTISFQSVLDSILPNMIPLVTVLACFSLYRRKISMIRVMLIVAVVTFILGALGLLHT